MFRLLHGNGHEARFLPLHLSIGPAKNAQKSRNSLSGGRGDSVLCNRVKLHRRSLLAAIFDFAIVTIAHGANGSRIINNFTITNGNDTIDIRRSGFAVTVAHWASPPRSRSA
jgi:hypothetical protein